RFHPLATVLSVSRSCSADHRDLHSFPTRRSSDLTGFDLLPTDEQAAAVCADLFSGDPVAERFVDEVYHGETGPGETRRMLDRARSEEHTSELQSRENLVCRLLLEKKKASNQLAHL